MGEIHTADSSETEPNDHPDDHVGDDTATTITIAQDQTEPLGVRIFTYSIVAIVVGIVVAMAVLLATLKDS